MLSWGTAGSRRRWMIQAWRRLPGCPSIRSLKTPWFEPFVITILWELFMRLPINILVNILIWPFCKNYPLGTFHQVGHQDTGQQGERISGLHRGGDQTNHLYSTLRVGNSIAITGPDRPRAPCKRSRASIAANAWAGQGRHSCPADGRPRGDSNLSFLKPEDPAGNADRCDSGPLARADGESFFYPQSPVYQESPVFPRWMVTRIAAQTFSAPSTRAACPSPPSCTALDLVACTQQRHPPVPPGSAGSTLFRRASKHHPSSLTFWVFINSIHPLFANNVAHLKGEMAKSAKMHKFKRPHNNQNSLQIACKGNSLSEQYM